MVIIAELSRQLTIMPAKPHHNAVAPNNGMQLPLASSTTAQQITFAPRLKVA